MQQTPGHTGPKAAPALSEAIARKRQTDHHEPRRTMNEMFRTFANGTAKVMGSPWTFFSAVLLIIVWAASYRLFVPPGANEEQWKRGFDTWQLMINTATTIITFLMVFLIQNTQNRDAKAIHLKLDEIIRSIHHAHNEMIDIEKLSDKELKELAAHYERIRAECERRDRGRDGAGSDDA